MAEAVQWQRAEGALVAAAGSAIYAFSGADYPWWGVAGLFLMPDLSFLAYGAGARVGAAVYNLMHLYGLGTSLLAMGFILGTPSLIAIGALWLAHSGADRAFGYGLKTGKGFHHTHLGAIGPARRNMDSDLPKP